MTLPTSVSADQPSNDQPYARRFGDLANEYYHARGPVTTTLPTWLRPEQREWLRALAETRGDEYLLETFPDYVGPRFPLAVLVGDTPGTRAPAYGAFTPWPNGCGEHLMRALLDTNQTLKNVGLVNSKNTNLDRLYVELGGPRLIALGQMALSRLNVYDLPVSGYVYHPQYEKRFRNRKHREYGTAILEATTPFSRAV